MAKVTMPKKEFVKEHQTLVKKLRKGDPKELKAEAKEQAKELKEKR